MILEPLPAADRRDNSHFLSALEHLALRLIGINHLFIDTPFAQLDNLLKFSKYIMRAMFIDEQCIELGERERRDWQLDLLFAFVHCRPCACKIEDLDGFSRA